MFLHFNFQQLTVLKEELRKGGEHDSGEKDNIFFAARFPIDI